MALLIKTVCFVFFFRTKNNPCVRQSKIDRVLRVEWCRLVYTYFPVEKFNIFNKLSMKLKNVKQYYIAAIVRG